MCSAKGGEQGGQGDRGLGGGVLHGSTGPRVLSVFTLREPQDGGPAR